MAERRPPQEVAFTPVTEAQWTPKKRGSTGGKRERSEYQKALDEMVSGAYDEEYNGKPVFLEVDADETAVKDLDRRIRNSATYLDVGVRFGEEQPSETKGKLIMSFLVGKKRARRTKNQTSDTAE